MTFLILLAMFAFVVLPTVSTYMQRSGPGMTDPVMAEFNGVSLTASRVNTFTQKHYATVQFLRKLAEETMRRGGTPQIPGFTLDQRTGQIQSVGISGSPSDEMSIRTLQFAAEAQKQGFELDDTSLDIWIEKFTDEKMSQRDIFTLLRRQTNNQMGQYQLYDMLRKQLLSALYFRGASASVARGQFPLQSPLDHWINFLKLNQKATLNAYGAVSEEVAAEMAEGALAHSAADIAVSITGIAGPGGSEHKPEGRVCFGVAFGSECHVETQEFGALGRANVRQLARDHALRLLLAGVHNVPKNTSSTHP